MDSGHGRIRMNVEGDRLSSLPDDLIHKILSFVGIKDTIGTSALSTRWRYIWTSTPYINISTQEFSTLPEFNKFVTGFLPRRNNLTEVYSLKFSFRGKVRTAVKRILDYAFSHNIQRMEVICLLENDIEFPLSLFNSQSLKHLSMTMQRGGSRWRSFKGYLTSTLELPTLTTLELYNVHLDTKGADNFISNISKCTNLKNITLKISYTSGSNGFSIIHPLLSNLTIEGHCCNESVINVVAPQLENLTIRSICAKLVISAPDLVSLLYKGDPPQISTDGFHSLEKADICLSSYLRKEYVHKFLCLFQQLHNVQFLTLNLELVEFLSVEVFKHQPSPFVNLKSLKIFPNQWERTPEQVTVMSNNEVKSYFLDSSPESTFTMVSREEVKATKIMAELRVILKKEKDDAKTNPKLKIGGDMTHIKSCWENLGVRIEKACVVISKLQDIEDLVTKLPASDRAKIQPCFSSLCAEADIVISQITDGMKIQCDDDQSLSSACFQINLVQHWRHFLSNLSVPYSR